jgi:hypothetical protein
VGSMLASNVDIVASSGMQIVGAVFVLHSCGFGLGYGLSKALGLSDKIARTNSIEVGMQSRCSCICQHLPLGQMLLLLPACTQSSLSKVVYRNELTAPTPHPPQCTGCCVGEGPLCVRPYCGGALRAQCLHTRHHRQLAGWLLGISAAARVRDCAWRIATHLTRMVIVSLESNLEVPRSTPVGAACALFMITSWLCSQGNQSSPAVWQPVLRVEVQISSRVADWQSCPALSYAAPTNRAA